MGGGLAAEGVGGVEVLVVQVAAELLDQGASVECLDSFVSAGRANVERLHAVNQDSGVLILADEGAPSGVVAASVFQSSQRPSTSGSERSTKASDCSIRADHQSTSMASMSESPDPAASLV